MVYALTDFALSLIFLLATQILKSRNIYLNPSSMSRLEYFSKGICALGNYSLRRNDDDMLILMTTCFDNPEHDAPDPRDLMLAEVCALNPIMRTVPVELRQVKWMPLF